MEAKKKGRFNAHGFLHQGLVITSVKASSAAGAAGVRSCMSVSEVDGEQVLSDAQQGSSLGPKFHDNLKLGPNKNQGTQKWACSWRPGAMP